MSRTRDSRDLALAIRADALRMVHRAKASHIGTCLSMADILAVLYSDVLRVDPADPEWAERDRFILSKGHGAAILYAVLAARGFIPRDELLNYCADDSRLIGHVSHEVPGVELSTGSLGHGLPVGAGMALALERGGGPERVFVLVGDGELDEGSNWEAALFASTHHLDRLTVVVDRNGLQAFGRTAEVMKLEPLSEKWSAFGWEVRDIDGHHHDQIRAALSDLPAHEGRPTVVLARTVKGKGVSFMEDRLEWHYRSPNDDDLRRALAELGAPR